MKLFCVIWTLGCIEAQDSDLVHRVVSILEPPFVSVNATGQYQGYLIDLIKLLKINYRLYLSPDGLYGSKNSVGEWNGAIGEILNGEADMALVALPYSKDIIEAIRPSVPILAEKLALVYYPIDGDRSKTIEDLVESPMLQFGAIRGSTADTFFRQVSSLRQRNETGGIYEKISDKLESSGYPQIFSGAQALQRVKAGGFVLVDSSGMFDQNQNNCGLEVMELFGFQAVRSLGFPKTRASFADMINEKILSLSKANELAKLHKKWFLQPCF